MTCAVLGIRILKEIERFSVLPVQTPGSEVSTEWPVTVRREQYLEIFILKFFLYVTLAWN